MSTVPVCRVKVRSLADPITVSRDRGTNLRKLWSNDPESNQAIVIDDMAVRIKDIVWIKDDYDVQQETFDDYVNRLSSGFTEEEEKKQEKSSFSSKWKNPHTGKPLVWEKKGEGDYANQTMVIGRWFKKTVYGKHGEEEIMRGGVKVLDRSGSGGNFEATIALCLVDPQNTDLELLDKYTADLLVDGESYNP